MDSPVTSCQDGGQRETLDRGDSEIGVDSINQFQPKSFKLPFRKNMFVANAFISPFNTKTMHIKSFYIQQHCYVFPKNLIPWRDLNPGLLVPEADAMSTEPRHQGKF
jgi:hypothetical protein